MNVEDEEVRKSIAYLDFDPPLRVESDDPNDISPYWQAFAFAVMIACSLGLVCCCVYGFVSFVRRFIN